MYKILRRKQLNDTVVRLDVEAPFIAKKEKQVSHYFKNDEHGERMPLTIADTNAEEGSVSIYLPDSWTDNYASFSDE